MFDLSSQARKRNSPNPPSATVDTTVVHHHQYTVLAKKIATQEEAATALLGGVEEGLDFFFHRYHLPLSWYAEKIVQDPVAAEDVIADSFVKLWSNRSKLQRASAIKAYLYSTVRNGCIDYLRKRNRIETSQHGFLQLQPGSEEDISARVIETETWNQIYAALDELPQRSGQVFVMYYLKQMSYAEIAQALGVSINTVRNQKVRAVELMRNKLPPHILTLLLSFSVKHLN